MPSQRGVLAFVLIASLCPFFSGAMPALLWVHGAWLTVGALVLSVQTRIRIEASPLVVVESCVFGLPYRRSTWSRSVELFADPGGWGDEPLLELREPGTSLKLFVDDRYHQAIIEEFRHALDRHRRRSVYR